MILASLPGVVILRQTSHTGGGAVWISPLLVTTRRWKFPAHSLVAYLPKETPQDLNCSALVQEPMDPGSRVGVVARHEDCVPNLPIANA
jgi:hypothetical protein